ncbi:MAG: CRISPR-associated helicase Cas3' [Acidobacteriaceae bacterium]|nr:CRISPR-associated helicase Cas3' [Acidobacteriaceae bacterium]
MKYWAHSDRSGLPPEAPDARWQPLNEHLRNVAALARQLAQHAIPRYTHFHQLAEWCGLLHDYGKYTDCFQQMIRTGKGKCPHAIHGAAMAFGGSSNDPIGLRAPHLGLAIAGHHAGIPDHSEFGDKVKSNRKEALELLRRASDDVAEIGALFQNAAPQLENVGSRFDLFTRMLFSCLIDADRLDTAFRPIIQAPLNAADRLQTLLRHIHGLSEQSADLPLRSARREVLDDCLAAASFPERILSLSVPTGGGKTLSAMAFALRRAALYPEQYRRIIVVIPYLSIIEQNAEVYARVFGSDAVLEHHSGSFVRLTQANKDHFATAPENEDHYHAPGWRAESENWDAPFIVTTSVRFFESLFSNHPSDLRRVHNIARSIVVLDEVQVLPRNLLGPLLAMTGELARYWGCSFVLATATKPAFERSDSTSTHDLRWTPGTVREIVRSPADLHARLRRVKIDWRIQEPVGWPTVAEWMLSHRQALCVVNLREHAAALFDQFGTSEQDTLFHLSTRMCAAHRLEVIASIRERLSNGLACLTVSTQLIEAGVDLDFPIAFRAIGPLDSIVQVAGRTDREGKLTDSLGAPGGKLVVFKPVDHRTPPNEYAHATGVTESLAATRSIQPDDLDAMANFFERYYGEADLGSKFVEWRKNAKFASIAAEFEMISSRTQDVFVPYGSGRTLIDELYRVGQLTADLRRRLQRYVVGLHPWEFQEARESGALSELRPESNVWIAGDLAYHREKGLQISTTSNGILA